jgi:hypothetical protein
MSMTPANHPQTNGTSNAAQPGPSSRRRNRRLQRIQDYLHQALTNPDPLAANVGAISSDLMKVQYRLTKAVDTALARAQDPVEEFRSFLPAIQTCSQLARQLYRFADLSCRLREAPGQKTPSESAERGPATDGRHREENES